MDGDGDGGEGIDGLRDGLRDGTEHIEAPDAGALHGEGLPASPRAQAEDHVAVIERLFDPDVSVLLAELEGGPRLLAELAAKSGTTPAEVESRLSYLAEHGYVARRADPGTGEVSYEADAPRLASAMESDENYQSAVDGLTKLDGFLN